MARVLVPGALVALVLLVAGALRSRRAAAPDRVNPSELGLPGEAPVAVVGFSSRFCVPCRRWEQALGDRGIPFTKVDVGARPDLARRYGIRTTPAVLAVRLPAGEVVEAFHDEPREDELERLHALTAA
ncbi:MAG TPA: thioredoxin family protein [Thermoleophilaceae bacterium]|nr:thioredoxin family protein [Thermoleophilaceae bacterium]